MMHVGPLSVFPSSVVGNGSTSNRLFRKCGCSTEETAGCNECQEKETLHRHATSATVPEQIPESVHEVLRTPGDSLDPTARAYLEPRFGHDFGRIRVHTGPKAADSAADVGAEAYTVGENVVFAQNRYQPSHDSGLRLIAHELGHTLGGDAGDRGSASGAGPISRPGDPSELAADRLVERVFSESGPAASAVPPGSPAGGASPVLLREGDQDKKKKKPKKKKPAGDKTPADKKPADKKPATPAAPKKPTPEIEKHLAEIRKAVEEDNLYPKDGAFSKLDALSQDDLDSTLEFLDHNYTDELRVAIQSKDKQNTFLTNAKLKKALDKAAAPDRDTWLKKKAAAISAAAKAGKFNDSPKDKDPKKRGWGAFFLLNELSDADQAAVLKLIDPVHRDILSKHVSGATGTADQQKTLTANVGFTWPASP